MSTVRSTLTRFSLASLLMGVLTGCGLTGPDTYGLEEKNVQVDVGEKFELSVPVDTAMGEWWYLTSPKPDAEVVHRSGEREDWEGDDDAVGSGSGTDLFEFKAVGTGKTKIRLIQCPKGACAGGGSAGGPITPSPVPSGSPTPDADERATIHTYTVTVKQP